MQKLNCWQFKNCGREKGGLLVDILGECPVAALMRLDGMNEGRGAGRSCWMVFKGRPPGCNGQPCHTCEFYRRVTFEEEEKACGRLASVEA